AGRGVVVRRAVRLALWAPASALASMIAARSVQTPPLSAQTPLPGAMSAPSPVLVTVKTAARAPGARRTARHRPAASRLPRATDPRCVTACTIRLDLLVAGNCASAVAVLRSG